MGGGLIAASFLVAVLLNRSANNEAAPVEARASRPPTFASILRESARRVPAACPTPSARIANGRSPQPLKR